MRLAKRGYMAKALKRFRRGFGKKSGQSLVEYSVVLALIALVVIFVVQGIGKKVNNTLSSVNANIP
jgi:Flp pilus assembly pilin Flp